jgi:mannose-6-phosphate isomerase-like protein (cupin superfamily)
MTTTTASPGLSREQLQARHIPFASLRPNTEAFIDYAIPGCAPKYNYAVIGAGVAQGDKQQVALADKHGFQVGGARMPPGITNPPHMHFTAEVFMCMQGRWDLHWGFNPVRHAVDFGPGDVCSVPTWIYRGFQNVGDHDGFLFTALGQDDTGGILWAPQTLQAAGEQGVHLTDDYRIIDERTGQKWDDASMRRLQPMTPQEMDALEVWTPEQMATRVVRYRDLQWSHRALLDAMLPGCGAEMAPVLGHGMSQDSRHAPPITNAHGHSIEWLRIPPGGRVSLHRTPVKQLLSCYRGDAVVEVEGVPFTLAGTTSAWDSYAVPADAWRTVRNPGAQEAVLLVISSGDARKPIEWSREVVQAAADAGYAIDANGCVALKRFTDRAQK